MARSERLIPLRSMPRSWPCPRHDRAISQVEGHIAQVDEERTYFADDCYYFCDHCRLGFFLTRVRETWRNGPPRPTRRAMPVCGIPRNISNHPDA